MEDKFYDVVEELIGKIKTTQNDSIEKAASMLAVCFENGNILQAHGSGHSAAAAMELCSRAGGFVPTKRLKEYSAGEYETVEGNGILFMKQVDIQPNDILFLISNSGRNPLSIEMAIEAKKKGAKIIVLTSMDTTTNVTSRHSSGKNLYQYADLVLDNCTIEGDATISIAGFDGKICAMSTIANSIIIQDICYRASKMIVADGKIPPIFKSKNIDGGEEHNKNLREKYFARLYHI